MLRASHLDVIGRHVLHQLGRIDALLIADADQIVESRSRQRYDRRTVEGGVVEPVQKMYRTRSRGADTNAQPSRMLGEAGRHERSGLLVADADILNTLLTLTERLDQRVDPVPHHAEGVRRAP